MFTGTFYLVALAVAVLSYLLGSVNCAIIVSRAYAGDDVRKHGSGSAGMTNILRTYGKGPAVVTAAGDFAKAVVAVLAGRLIFGLVGLSAEDGFPIDAGYIAGLFALLGHLFPVFFRFKGGKGVMTTLGVIFMTDPVVFLIIAAVFVPLVFIVRIVSICSIMGAAVYPFLTWGFHVLWGKEPLFDTVIAAVIAIAIIVMHRKNIERLIAGTEHRFGTKKQ